MASRLAFINESSQYVRERLLACFEERKNDGWTVVTPVKQSKPVKKGKTRAHTELPPNADLQWDDYENINWEKVLKGELMCNAYCFRKGLTRKIQLAKNMEHYISKHPESLLKQSAPMTYVIEIPTNDYEYGDGGQTVDEDDEDADYMLGIRIEDALEEINELFYNVSEGNAAPYWILKPSMGSKGAEVVVAEDYQTVYDTVKKWKDICQWVLQQYIDKPLLIYGGKKFHMRVHVLASGTLQVYVHQDIIALISSESYVREFINNRMMHITNSCVQRESSGFNEDATVRLLSELEADKQITPEQAEIIFEKVKTNVREVFRAVGNQPSAFLVLPNCFELFGFDFLVDEDLNVWVLEVNCGPDMKNTGDRLDHVVSSFLEDVLNVTVDKYFKKDKFYESLPHTSTPATIAQYGRLHLVYNAEVPKWGNPNMSQAIRMWQL